MACTPEPLWLQPSRLPDGGQVAELQELIHRVQLRALRGWRRVLLLLGGGHRRHSGMRLQGAPVVHDSPAVRCEPVFGAAFAVAMLGTLVERAELCSAR